MKCYTNVVTATFKNVKKGTYYVGLRAFNRTSVGRRGLTIEKIIGKIIISA